MCALVSGTRMFAADPPWFRLDCPELVIWTKIWGIKLKRFQNQFLLCGKVHYSAERGHSQQRMRFSMTGSAMKHGLQHCPGRCQINIHMIGGIQGFPAEHCLKHHAAATDVALCIVVPCVDWVSDEYTLR
ncbi:hypothetical protein XENORESO_005337 [Xenotaenia resolanae]|uniref:Uncharacterized protein n=1 Tax=Xenotaenia resolanae TaxID=208358 RepID=A0ABV0W1E4_9TELE